MKKHEHAAQLAAARAEVERLMAIVPETERPGMVLPDQNNGGHWYGWTPRRNVIKMASAEQYHEYMFALETLLLMRAQNGIVNPAESDHWFICVDIKGLCVYNDTAGDDDLHCCMFPCFATEADARAAIAAVGQDRIVRCAKWLAGCA